MRVTYNHSIQHSNLESVHVYDSVVYMFVKDIEELNSQVPDGYKMYYDEIFPPDSTLDPDPYQSAKVSAKDFYKLKEYIERKNE